jgi:hypothetical protein
MSDSFSFLLTIDDFLKVRDLFSLCWIAVLIFGSRINS